jgi:5'-nucleotidase
MTDHLRLPRLLLTNDDGIDAAGLGVLVDIASEFSNEVWVVAPEHDQSGTGQSVSIHHALRCYPRGERRFAVTGTPSDCVALAYSHLMADKKPSLILSGVNAGSNIGDEVGLSGTLGAAFTGMLLGVPSIAFSIDCVKRSEARWDTAREVVPKLLRHFLTHGWRKDTCLSINIPDRDAKDITGFSWSRQSTKNIAGFHVEKREDLRDQNYYWLSIVDKAPAPREHSDYETLQRGDISVMALGHDRSVDISEPSVIFDEAADAAED